MSFVTCHEVLLIHFICATTCILMSEGKRSCGRGLLHKVLKTIVEEERIFGYSKPSVQFYGSIQMRLLKFIIIEATVGPQ